jgi:hypothetical protein
MKYKAIVSCVGLLVIGFLANKNLDALWGIILLIILVINIDGNNK